MRFALKTLATALVIGLALPSASAAQGGGASSTGTIQGRVADSSAAVLPGVTVTATSPSMIGTQTQVTNENGLYRFPAVPPGVYELTFELAGFNTVKRGNVQISLGFTATVNADLAVATLQETVTVTGESPVTVTVSCSVASASSAFTLAVKPSETSTPSRLTVRKPASSNISSYTPGGTAGNRKDPFSLVTCVCVPIIDGLAAVTVTPGSTAALLSATRP